MTSMFGQSTWNMSDYYKDPSKITFDRAEVLVERYIRLFGDKRSRVTSGDVAREFDIEKRHHNIHRINKALGERLELVREPGSKPAQYKLTDDR